MWWIVPLCFMRWNWFVAFCTVLEQRDFGLFCCVFSRVRVELLSVVVLSIVLMLQIMFVIIWSGLCFLYTQLSLISSNWIFIISPVRIFFWVKELFDRSLCFMSLFENPFVNKLFFWQLYLKVLFCVHENKYLIIDIYIYMYIFFV